MNVIEVKQKCHDATQKKRSFENHRAVAGHFVHALSVDNISQVSFKSYQREGVLDKRTNERTNKSKKPK